MRAVTCCAVTCCAVTCCARDVRGEVLRIRASGGAHRVVERGPGATAVGRPLPRLLGRTTRFSTTAPQAPSAQHLAAPGTVVPDRCELHEVSLLRTTERGVAPAAKHKKTDSPSSGQSHFEATLVRSTSMYSQGCSQYAFFL